MEQAMREEFEAWVSGRKVCTRYGAKLNTNPDGMYSDYRINDRWLAWKASRAALRVELPDDGIDDCQRDCGNSCRDNFDTGYCYATDRITQALQQAGIEVKHG
ncbi:TPA: hypothetical protein ACKROO_004691 [Pseudomonas aeruginosa]